MTTAERFNEIDRLAGELNKGNIPLQEFQKQAIVKANGILSRSTRQMALDRVQHVINEYLDRGGKPYEV